MHGWRRPPLAMRFVFWGIKGKRMNVLDLDLDFFQNGRITDGFCGQADNVTAWTEVQVRDYLENHLKLSK